MGEDSVCARMAQRSAVCFSLAGIEVIEKKKSKGVRGNVASPECSNNAAGVTKCRCASVHNSTESCGVCIQYLFGF